MQILKNNNNVFVIIENNYLCLCLVLIDNARNLTIHLNKPIHLKA